jgi:hypothetical protein
MTSLARAGICAALALAACGGEAVIDGEPREGGGGDGGGGGGNAVGGGGAGQLRVELESATVFVACSPGSGTLENVPIDLELDNTAGGGAALLTIAGATLVSFDVFTAFQVTPQTVTVPAGTTQTGVFDSVPGSASGNDPCVFCMDPGTRIVLDLVIDGVPDELDRPITSISCSF